MTATKKYNEAQIEQMVKDYLVKEFMHDSSEENLSNDLPLIQEGIIDSLRFLKLVKFLEEEFGVTLNPKEFLLKNFGTINAIKSFIISKLQ